MSAPAGLVLNAPGINCNLETGHAIKMAGGRADQVHISELRDGSKRLEDYQMLFISGGFSYGDDIASGRILGLELRTRFYEELNRFVEAGKAVVGICNGLQVLVESGLLPNGKATPSNEGKTISLVNNANNNFEWRWNRLKILDSKCKFILKDWVGKVVELPVGHQEGRVAARDIWNLEKLYSFNQVVFSFVDDTDEPTEVYPDNPNGSFHGMTGFTDSSGVVLGLMPHPERAVYEHQHPNCRRGEGKNPFGALLFKNIINHAREI